VQRGEATDHPFKWEFPGGKMASDETEEECVIREVKEELSMEIVICSKLAIVDHDYGHKQISLIPFICDTLDDIPFLSEHIAYKWIEEKELLKLDFSEADVFVAEDYLERMESERRSEGADNTTSDEGFSEDAELQSIVQKMMSIKEAEWVAETCLQSFMDPDKSLRQISGNDISLPGTDC